MNEESRTPNIDPELEARIIALVLGEASDFEDQQLGKLIESRPDLAAFKMEMQRVHGLLTDVGATEFQAPAADWRLPSEKRNAVLAVIRGEATVQRAASYVNDATASGNVETSHVSGSSSGVSSAVARRWKWNPAYVAVALCLAAFMGLIFLPVVQSPRESSRYFAGAAKEELNVSQVEVTGGVGIVFSKSPSQSLVDRADLIDSKLEGFDEGRSANSTSALSALSEIQDSLKFEAATSESFDLFFGLSLDQHSDGFIAAPVTGPVTGPAVVSGEAENSEVSGRAPVTRTAPTATASPSSGLGLPAIASGGIDLPELVADSGLTWGFNGGLNGGTDGKRYENGQQSSPEDALDRFYERQQSSTYSSFGRGLAAPDLPAEADAERDKSSNGTLLLQDGHSYWDRLDRPFAAPVEAQPGAAQPGAVQLGEEVLLGEGKSSKKLGQQLWELNSDLSLQNDFGGENHFRYSMPSESDRVGVDFDFNIGDVRGVAPAPAQQQQQANGQGEGVAGDSDFSGGIAGGALIAGQSGQSGPQSINGVFLFDGRSGSDAAMPSGEERLSEVELSVESSRSKVAAPQGVQASGVQANGVGGRLQETSDFEGENSNGRVAGSRVSGGQVSGGELGKKAQGRGTERSESLETSHSGSMSIEGTGDDSRREISKIEDRPSINRRRHREATQNSSQLLLPFTGTVRQKAAERADGESAGAIYGQFEDFGVDGLRFDGRNSSDNRKQLEAIDGYKAPQSEPSLRDFSRIDESLNMPVLKNGDGQPGDDKSSNSQLGVATWSELNSRRSKSRELAEQEALIDLEFSSVDFVDLDQTIAPIDPPTADRQFLSNNESDKRTSRFGNNDAVSDETPETISSKSSNGSMEIAGKAKQEAVELKKQQQGPMVVLESSPSSPMDLFGSTSRVPAPTKKSKPNPVRSEKQDAMKRTWRDPSLDTYGERLARENQKGFFFKNRRLQLGLSAENLNESTTKENAFSTFSLHVSDVSFKLAFAALVKGEWPDAAKIRIEEFVNAFDYGDPSPSSSEKVACQVEQSIHPFLQQRNLLRVAMKTGAAGRASSTPLRLTFLLDNSGSMERPDRQQTIRRAFQLLTEQLNPTDHVTLISFARQPRLLADSVHGGDAKKLVEVIETLPSEGGTNIEAALQLAYEKAKEHQSSGAQNRIILLTDGAVNLGNANPDSLSQMVASMRNSGIAFDAAGIVADGLNDEVLEALTRKGDGRYYLLDSEESADNDFAKQIAGALRPSAKNVKVQIEFNPKRVGRYKLLGFEKHILKKQDFRNDKIVAAEMAAAEAGVALYQFEAMPDGEGDVGSVSVRFQDLSTGQMVENQWPIPYEANAPRIDQAAESVRIAAAAALLAAKLRGEPLGESVNLKGLSVLIDGLPEANRNNERIQMLRTMIQKARQLAGE